MPQSKECGRESALHDQHLQIPPTSQKVLCDVWLNSVLNSGKQLFSKPFTRAKLFKIHTVIKIIIILIIMEHFYSSGNTFSLIAPEPIPSVEKTKG